MPNEISLKLFKNTKVSRLYQECRPGYTDSSVMGRILQFMQASLKPPYEKAADIGCGTGLSTQPLIPHFKSVVGIDHSPSQIDQARRSITAENVQFCIGSAEDLDMLPDASLDLLTVGTAVHYFKIDGFHKELDRVLKPGGTFAQFGYNHRYASQQKNSLSIPVYERHPEYEAVSRECNQLYGEIFKNLLCVTGYQAAVVKDISGIEPPVGYLDQERYTDELIYPCTVSTLVGIFQTTGPWLNYCEKSGVDSDELANRYKERFLQILERLSDNPEGVAIMQHLALFIRLSRKPLA